MAERAVQPQCCSSQAVLYYAFIVRFGPISQELSVEICPGFAGAGILYGEDGNSAGGIRTKKTAGKTPADPQTHGMSLKEVWHVAQWVYHMGDGPVHLGLIVDLSTMRSRYEAPPLLCAGLFGASTRVKGCSLHEAGFAGTRNAMKTGMLAAKGTAGVLTKSESTPPVPPAA
ncbi:hypothetical protein V8E55_007905 [Tylopilus felleus]